VHNPQGFDFPPRNRAPADSEVSSFEMVAVMTVDAQREFRASMHCLPDAAAFVESFCRSQGISANDRLRLTLIVEELFTNAVHHGYGGDSDAPIRLTLNASPTEIGILFEDAAPAFDPGARLAQSEARLEAELKDWPVGGFGVALVAQMVSSLSYVREDDSNRLRLVLPRQA
jgi:anti-sigma regulatory factor (Ser/Thr protein kinase)